MRGDGLGLRLGLRRLARVRPPAGPRQGAPRGENQGMSGEQLERRPGESPAAFRRRRAIVARLGVHGLRVRCDACGEETRHHYPAEGRLAARRCTFCGGRLHAVR